MHTKAQLIAFNTIFSKECRRFIRIWVQTLVPPVITMSLYFIIFGSLIGSQIGTIHGFSYMQFIVPGLTMMAIITNAYMNVCSSFFSSKFQRSVEEVMVAPVANSVVIWGYAMGGVVRALLIGAIVLGVALFFTQLELANVGCLLLFSVLTAVLFSLGGLANAILAKKFDDISIIPTFVLTPLTYLGGVFYSIDKLSPFWQTLSRANPILYMVNGFRYGFLGISDVDLSVAAGLLTACCVVLYYFNLSLLRKGTGLRS